MDTNQKLITMDTKTTLSTLWIFVLLNVIFRDIHELFRQGLLEEMMTGTVNGVHLTEGTMLVAGIGMEIMIVMVILSRVLRYRTNRLVNMIIGVISFPLIIGAGPQDLDDIFFTIIEFATLALIIWYAWKWPNPELSPR
jgi:hypothetical protein